jgi:hypothetical protein
MFPLVPFPHYTFRRDEYRTYPKTVGDMAFAITGSRLRKCLPDDITNYQFFWFSVADVTFYFLGVHTQTFIFDFHYVIAATSSVYLSHFIR